MNCNNCQYYSFRIIFNVDIFVFCKAQIFDTDCVTDFQTGYIDPDVYSADTHSFSMDKSYTLRVSKRYLSSSDQVLLVDDILSNGQTILSLLELVSKAGGETVGVGVAIEKSMREGGKVLRRMGIRVEALATVQAIEGQRIILE